MTRFAARSPAVAHAFASALDDDVRLDGPSGHHLSRVRRLRSGELVTVADGNGTWRPYIVSVVRPGAVELHADGAFREAHRYDADHILPRGTEEELSGAPLLSERRGEQGTRPPPPGPSLDVVSQQPARLAA